MDDSFPAVPALALTRGLFLLVLALMLGALIYAGWATLSYAGHIGV